MNHLDTILNPFMERRVIVVVTTRKAANSVWTANKSYMFDWSGRTDAYGQPLQGAQIAKVRIGYVYRAFYNLPPSVAASFGSNSGKPVPGNVEAREGVTLWQEEDVQLGGWNTPRLALGGWSLDVHHAYDPMAKTLYRGDGRQQKAEGQFAASIKTVAGGLNATGLMPQGSQTSPARSTRLLPPYFGSRAGRQFIFH